MIYKAVIGFLLVMIVISGARELLGDDAPPPKPQLAAPSTPPAPALESQAVIDARLRDTVKAMSRAEAETFFRIELEKTCQAVDKHLNYITVQKRGSGLYCVHSLYGQQAFAAGPRGPAIEAFAQKWGALLKQHKITRVGVFGTGELASGTWFEIT